MLVGALSLDDLVALIGPVGIESWQQQGHPNEQQPALIGPVGIESTHRLPGVVAGQALIGPVGIESWQHRRGRVGHGSFNRTCWY